MDFKLHDMDVEVIQKNIKNIHLSVYPPHGHIRVSAPETMSIETIRNYVISKLSWIKKQQKKLLSQAREAQREYLDKESHYFNGKRFLLKVIEHEAAPQVILSHSQIVLWVRPGSSEIQKRALLDAWYRQHLKESIRPLIEKWEMKMGLKIAKCTIRRMKTKWGNCSPTSKSIRVNLELAKKPPEFLEYIIVHELAHMIEPSHNDRFIGLMDKYLPKWRFYREELNILPVRHENWRY